MLQRQISTQMKNTLIWCLWHLHDGFLVLSGCNDIHCLSGGRGHTEIGQKKQHFKKPKIRTSKCGDCN